MPARLWAFEGANLMNRNARRMLAASVSLTALVPTLPALATTVPGSASATTAAAASLTFELSSIEEASSIGQYSVTSALINSTSNGQIDLEANGTTSGTLNVTNTGTVSILAEGTEGEAVISTYAVDMDAYAPGSEGAASVDFSNTGSLTIAAESYDEGESAFATASYVNGAMFQTATGEATASVSLSNAVGASLVISAEATALVTEGSEGWADAQATFLRGIGQGAYADEGGSASVALTNDGALSITAHAVAGQTVEGTATLAPADAVIVSHRQTSLHGFIVSPSRSMCGAQ